MTQPGQSVSDAEVGQLNDAISEIMQPFKGRDDMIRTVDSLIYDQRIPHMPPAMLPFALKVLSPLPRRHINILTGVLASKPISFHSPPNAGVSGTTAETRATNLERFYAASWDQQKKDAGLSLLWRFVHADLAYGHAILKKTLRTKTAWAMYAERSKRLYRDLANTPDLDVYERLKRFDRETEGYKREEPFPIVSSVVHPGCFYDVKGEFGMARAVEVCRVDFYEAMANYELGVSEKGKLVPQALGLPRPEWHHVFGGQTPSTLVCKQLWTDKDVTTLVEGIPGQDSKMIARRIPHKYGTAQGTLRGPYFMAYGQQTSSPDIERIGESVLAGYETLYQLHDSVLTVTAQHVYNFGWPMMTTDAAAAGKMVAETMTPPDPDAEDADTEPGAFLKPGAKFISPPQLSLDWDRLESRVVRELDGVAPPVLEGRTVAESGYDRSQATFNASLRLAQIQEGIENAMSDATNFEGYLIGLIGEPVTVPGVYVERQGVVSTQRYEYLTVTPKDVAGTRVLCTLSRLTPSDELLALRAAEARLGLGLSYPAMEIDRAGDNPDEVEAGIALTRAKQHPLIVQRFDEAVAAAMAAYDQDVLDEALAKFTEAGQNYSEAGVIPGGGVGDVFAPTVNMPAIPPTPGSGMGPGSVPGEPALPLNSMGSP